MDTKIKLPFGVFIRSGEVKGDIIDNCKRFLQKIESSAKIVGAKKNEACKGLEVFFNCKLAELELLKKKYLIVGNGVSTIHSLTTALTLHNAFPPKEEDFKNAVRNQIQNLTSTQVLDIKKVPFSSGDPDIGSGKWIIFLDVPEIDDSDVFKSMGLLDMVLKFPSNGGCYRTTFYCRLCQEDGHIQFRCSKGASDEISSPSLNISNNASSSKTQSIDCNNPAINIKRERDEKTDDMLPFSTKRFKTKSPPPVNLSNQEIYPHWFDKEPNTSISTSNPTIEKDEVEVVFESSNPSYNPPIVPLEPQTVMPELPTNNPAFSRPIARPRKTFQVIIPEKIRVIIADIPKKILHIQELEAFFTHVKKKPCPAEFARMYTENVEGLFDQLKEIHRRYYLSPSVGSNEDTKFVKMMAIILQRYYNGYTVPHNSLYKLPV